MLPLKDMCAEAIIQHHADLEEYLSTQPMVSEDIKAYIWQVNQTDFSLFC